MTTVITINKTLKTPQNPQNSQYVQNPQKHLNIIVSASRCDIKLS